MAATRSAPPRQRYRLGDMTTLRSGLRSYFKAEGLGVGMGDVIMGMAGLGESGQTVSASFEDG